MTTALSVIQTPQRQLWRSDREEEMSVISNSKQELEEKTKRKICSGNTKTTVVSEELHLMEERGQRIDDPAVEIGLNRVLDNICWALVQQLSTSSTGHAPRFQLHWITRMNKLPSPQTAFISSTWHTRVSFCVNN